MRRRLCTRGHGSGLRSQARADDQRRAPRRVGLADLPMWGQTSRTTGADRNAFPELAATGQVRASGGSDMLGREAADTDGRAPIELAPDASPTRPPHRGGPGVVVSADGQIRRPGNLRRCRAGRGRAG